MNIEEGEKEMELSHNEHLEEIVEHMEDKTVYPYYFFKRVFDFLFSLILLVATSPVVLIAIICIVIESFGNPFYTQERVGHLGRSIRIIKLRSMRLDAEKNGAQWAKDHDNRVTKVGHFIRKTRIDELPQLMNVLKGEMSLIGPRPERPMFTEQFCYDVPGFEKRLQVRPGLTGLAQVSGGYEHTPAQKLEYDVEYIKNYGLLQDLKIFIKTIGVVVTGDGAR